MRLRSELGATLAFSDDEPHHQPGHAEAVLFRHPCGAALKPGDRVRNRHLTGLRISVKQNFAQAEHRDGDGS